jgi:hypothetical protein
MRGTTMIRQALAVGALSLLCACTSTTTIRASDPDARIYVNDEYIGTGSARYSDRKVAFTKQNVTLRKEGCQVQQHSFRRNEKPDAGAIVSGLLITVPFLWLTEYKDEHAYEYDCQPIAESGQASTEAG